MICEHDWRIGVDAGSRSVVTICIHCWEHGPAVVLEEEPKRDPHVFGDTLGKFHKGAGKTERDAASRTLPGTGTQKRLIYDAVKAAGLNGLIDEEIAQIPGVKNTAHRTRRNELVSAGWLQDSGRVRLTQSGSESIVWTAT